MRTAICGHPNADVAQLVEQGFRKAKVGGSSPSIGTISLFHNRSEYAGNSPLFRYSTIFLPLRQLFSGSTHGFRIVAAAGCRQKLFHLIVHSVSLIERSSELSLR